jgi:hypothetical protein
LTADKLRCSGKDIALLCELLISGGLCWFAPWIPFLSHPVLEDSSASANAMVWCGCTRAESCPGMVPSLCFRDFCVRPMSRHLVLTVDIAGVMCLAGSPNKHPGSVLAHVSREGRGGMQALDVRASGIPFLQELGRIAVRQLVVFRSDANLASVGQRSNSSNWTVCHR